MSHVQLTITSDTALAIERYTEAKLAMVREGASPRALEEVRSYAVEALVGILNANPGEFRYVETLRELGRARGDA